MLRKDKTLGGAAMIATLLATMIGSLPAHRDIGIEGVFFGVDFFILNVLFTGLLFIPIERLFPQNPDQAVLRDEWREDLFYYLVSSLFIQLLTYLTLAPSNFVVHNPELGSIRAFARDLPWIVQFAAIMVLTDLAQYWLHRAFHRVPFLWRFHAVHHSAKSMDWIAGARMHFAGDHHPAQRNRDADARHRLFRVGDPGLHAAGVRLLDVHSFEFSGSFGFLEKILVVPRFHHWHHGIEKEAVDVNFAIHFPFLDRLFGTHHLPEGTVAGGIRHRRPSGPEGLLEAVALSVPAVGDAVARSLRLDPRRLRPPCPTWRSRRRGTSHSPPRVVPTTSTPIFAMRSWKPLSAMIAAISRLSVSMIAGGVPAGATSPTPEPTRTSGSPTSAMVGTSGNDAMRLLLEPRRAARSLPSLISGSSELTAPMNMSMRPASRSGSTTVAPRNGTWIRSTPGAHLEQLAAEMLRRADADRSEGQLVRRFLRQRDELLHRLHRQARRHHHDEGHVGDQIDRREILDRMVELLLRQMRSHRERGRRDQHACGRRAADLATN